MMIDNTDTIFIEEKNIISVLKELKKYVSLHQRRKHVGCLMGNLLFY